MKNIIAMQKKEKRKLGKKSQIYLVKSHQKSHHFSYECMVSDLGAFECEKAYAWQGISGR